MKKLLALGMSFVMVLTLTGILTGCTSGGSDKNVIKIGIFEPASGDNGAGGKQETLGIEYAHSLKDTVEIDGKEYKIELVKVDNQSSTDKAVSAASTLVSEQVSVVLGSYGSGVSIAAADTFADAGIPAIGLSCTNPAVTEGNDYYYRICFLDPFQGTVMANYAADSGAKTAYVLAQLGDDYSVGLATYFKEAFEKLGGKVVDETFPEGTSDYSAYITSATNAGADVFFSPSSTTAASLIISQAASAKVDYSIMAGDTWENSVILDAAKGTDLNIALSTFFDENDDNATAAEFVNGFKKYLNDNKDKLTDNGGNDTVAAVSALGYDGYMVALEAIKAANSTDSEEIATALSDVTYDGVTGSIKFNEIGDAEKDMAYIKTVDVKTGTFKFEKTQTIADVK
ncbi:ABC transporter substrate-binding protein [Alloiococcus sp. CFN-8]|uniref:ABC transporter substrate-binding protein n=1 Tax=Alloiococcus sp. CFN-8 TaxID=3416081 RepID=UPI003CF84B1B